MHLSKLSRRRIFPIFPRILITSYCSVARSRGVDVLKTLRVTRKQYHIERGEPLGPDAAGYFLQSLGLSLDTAARQKRTEFTSDIQEKPTKFRDGQKRPEKVYGLNNKGATQDAQPRVRSDEQAIINASRPYHSCQAPRQAFRDASAKTVAESWSGAHRMDYRGFATDGDRAVRVPCEFARAQRPPEPGSVALCEPFSSASGAPAGDTQSLSTHVVGENTEKLVVQALELVSLVFMCKAKNRLESQTGGPAS